MIKQIFAFIFLLLLAACSKKTIVDGQETDPTRKMVKKAMTTGEVPIDERVVIGTLPNGMKYYIHKNNKPENRAELRLAVNAGSILEDDDQKGVAHFVEHMAFNGTKNFRKSELVDYLESVGTRFGPDLNAYTSFDETVYMLQVRTDDSLLFDKGMLILKDWASGISFEHQEIDKERGVVESEWRSRLSPDERMQKVTFPVIYKGSQYAERLPIGDPETIKTSDYSIFKRFYKDWYRPDLMAIVVVGDINPQQVEMQIKEQFGAIPAALTPRERKEYVVPPHPGTLIAIANDKEASFTNITIMNKLPKSKVNNMNDMRRSLLVSAYNGMLNARLEELGKTADPPFIFAFTGYSSDVGDIDSYTSFALVPEGKSQQAIEKLLEENKRVLDHGFTQGELERQKARMLTGAEKNFKEMDKTASGQLSMRYVYNYLDSNPIPSPKQMLEIYSSHLPSINLEEINALPIQWITEDNRVITVTGAQKSRAKLPTEEGIRSIITKVNTSVTEPYIDDVVVGPLLDKVLSPVTLSELQEDKISGITSYKLENGVAVYLKPTTFKNDEIIMTSSSVGGNSVYGNSGYFNATQAAAVAVQSGIGKFSSTQMQKLMSGKTAYVAPYIGTYYEGMNGGASPKDVEDMFKMVYLYFTDVREDTTAFKSFVKKQMGLYKNLRSNPSFYFSDYASKLKFRNHPRVGFPTAAKFKGMDYKKTMDKYKDRFSNASDFAFTFVGNFEVEKMKVLTQKYLGNLPTTDRKEMWKDPEISSIPGQLKKRIKRGTAPKTQVEMYFHGEIEYTPEKAYHLQSMIDYVKIKLREELREDKGGVYGVGVSGGAGKVPAQKYSITISFNADPDKADELIKAAMGVIIKAKKEGPDDMDMTKVKETQRQSKIKNLEQNRYWSQQINRVHNDGDLDFSAILLPSMEMKLSKLTADNIRDAAKTYFNMNNFIQVVMDPKVKPQN